MWTSIASSPHRVNIWTPPWIGSVNSPWIGPLNTGPYPPDASPAAVNTGACIGACIQGPVLFPYTGACIVPLYRGLYCSLIQGPVLFPYTGACIVPLYRGLYWGLYWGLQGPVLGPVYRGLSSGIYGARAAPCFCRSLTHTHTLSLPPSLSISLYR
jgi:hypothetical protein